jgi:hypothetical protein
MVDDPTAAGEMTPVLELIVATAGLDEAQEPPPTVDVKVDVPLIHIPSVPLNVPADGGAAVTVTVRVAVTLVQPPVAVLVYVIVAVPAATPLTTPVDSMTVAIAVLLLDHINAPVPPDAVTEKVVVFVPPELQMA